MPEPNSDRTVPVLVEPEPDPEEDGKGLFGRRAGLVVEEIPLGQLQEQLTALTQDIATLADGAASGESGSIRLSELSVQVEVTASGGINLIGTASVGANAAITLTFTR